MNRNQKIGMLAGSILAFAVILLAVSLVMTPSSPSSGDSGFPVGSFFVIFILPGIIAAQKARKEEERKLMDQKEEEY